MLFFNSILLLIVFISYLAGMKKNSNNEASLFFVIIASFFASLLAGFRTRYNDTERYIYNFKYLVADNFDQFSQSLDLTIGNNPGFQIYQFFIKNFLYDDPQIFLIISSLITYISIFLFIRKYSINYSHTIFLIIASSFFMLGMAAIKQMLALSIGIWAIYFYLQNRYIKMFIVILIASLFHPFILLYLVVFIVDDEVWSKKIILSFLGVLFLGMIFKSFINTLLSAVSTIGVNYDASYILEAEGMNIFRVLIFSVVPILSYIYRNEIKNTNNKMLTISINFSVIGFLFIILASYGGANMFGRLTSYFEIFIYLSLTFIIFNLVNPSYRFIFVLGTSRNICRFFWAQNTYPMT